MNRWGIKSYNAYSQFFLGWLIVDFAIPWAIFGLFIAFLWSDILEGFSKVMPVLNTLALFLMCLLCLFFGFYQRGIDCLLFSPFKIWVAMDGIYGKGLLRFFLYFTKPRLLVRWEEIEKVVLRSYPFSPYPLSHVGYVEIIKKDGSKLHISIQGTVPSNWRVNDLDFLRDKTDRNFCLELFGVVAWKVGLERFEGFPEEESQLLNGIRKNPLSMEGFRRVIQSIEVGVNGGAREDIPYKQMDEKWLQEEIEERSTFYGEKAGTTHSNAED